MLLRAMYPFKKTHPTSIGFNQGDVFVELSGASKDKNWHYVLNTNGEAGYVPKNYVMAEQRTAETQSFLDGLRDRLRMKDMPHKDKAELLSNLEGARARIMGIATSTAAGGAKAVTVNSTSGGGGLTVAAANSVGNSSAGSSNGGGGSAGGSGSVSPRPVSPRSNASSDRSSTPPKSMKKRAAPKPPAVDTTDSVQAASENKQKQQQQQQQQQHVEAVVSVENPLPLPQKSGAITAAAAAAAAAGRDSRRGSAQQMHLLERRMSSELILNQRRPSAADPTPEQIRCHARDLVELVRIETGLSHSNSQSVVQTVLGYVCTNLPRLDKHIPAVLGELEAPVLADAADVAASADTKAMKALFEQLTRCKEDDQQRNWMLHEDEAVISGSLQALSAALQNSDPRVSCFVLSNYKYFYVHNLVEYYQMETRWSLRKLLIENFMLMCTLEPVVISLMLSSVLPLELAQDLFQNTDSVRRLRMCGLLLTVIFSRGEPMPVQYFEQLGNTFANFLLDYVEAPPTCDAEREVPDVFIGLALSYNLQFADIRSNVLVNCLASRSGAKTWTEKVLLLLNREEDPTAIVLGGGRERKERGGGIPNSVHKIVMDMFLHDTCHQLFYTNDIYVLIDIVVRQLADLSPRDSARSVYVDICRLVLTHTDYTEHLHRFKDLEHCFIRILQEEEEEEGGSSARDKMVVEQITMEVEAFDSLKPENV